MTYYCMFWRKNGRKIIICFEIVGIYLIKAFQSKTRWIFVYNFLVIIHVGKLWLDVEAGSEGASGVGLEMAFIVYAWSYYLRASGRHSIRLKTNLKLFFPLLSSFNLRLRTNCLSLTRCFNNNNNCIWLFT